MRVYFGGNARIPSELRILRFKLGEVEMSLRTLGPRIGMNFPVGDFISAAEGTDMDVLGASFEVKGSTENVTVTHGKLAASLIHYCREIGIPLPRQGKKEIYIAPQFVELRIGLRHTPIFTDADDAVEI